MELFIGAFISVISQIYMWSNYEKIKIKKTCLVAVALITTIFFLYINKIQVELITIPLYFTFLMLINNYILKVSIIKSFLILTLNYVVLIISEILYIIIIILLKQDPKSILSVNSLNTTIVISTIAIVITIINKTLKIKNELYSNNAINYIKKKKTSIIMIIILLNIIFQLYISNTVLIDNLSIFVINFIVTITFVIISVFLLHKTTQLSIIEQKNKTITKELKNYEDMLDRERINNHENKNQLLIIQDMSLKNDKKLSPYLNSLINNDCEIREDFYTKTKKIPSGGLQGLIYQKILYMENRDIMYDLKIDNKVKHYCLENVQVNTIIDLCLISGIIIDNSIEAVENTNHKTRIELKTSKKVFTIKISNKVNIEKNNQSKGDRRGYGLRLAKEIVISNSNITLETILFEEQYIQILKVNIE